VTDADAARFPLPTTCHGCGACCEQQAGLPITWYRVVEPDAPLPPELRAEIDETARRWGGLGVWQGPGEGAPCVWYDRASHRCRHYEHRPEVCRDFPVGGEDCLAWRLRVLPLREETTP
jgi:uncharacterized protein